MIKEVEHYYLDEINKNNLNSLVNCQNKLYTNVILIDDLHIDKNNVTITKSDLEQTLFNLGVDKIFYESYFINFGEMLLTKLQKLGEVRKEYFRKSEKYVYFYVKEESKIPLCEENIDGKIRFYCVHLSLIWLLFKLTNFDEDTLIKYLTLNEKFIPTNNICNLQVEYKDVELNVLQLLAELDDSYVNYITYYWKS